MAPIIPPQEKTESFLFDETGVFLFTQEQRTSRRFSVVVEKVALAPRVEYYNYSTPEPKSFWGYIQIVRRDSIVRTIPLEYRRQIIYSWDSYELEPIEQLRCLIKDSTLLLFDNLVPLLLAGGADAEQIGQDRAEYLLRNGQPRLIPTIPDTGFYYEIQSDRGARITLIWQDYLTPCENPGGKQFLQSPRATGKNESGPGGNDGGGTRPAVPPPDDRSSDPDSDNAAPPPGDPAIPTPDEPAPPPFTGWVRVVWGGGAFLLDSCVEEPFGPVTIDIQIPSAEAVITVKDPVPALEYQVCGQTVNDYTFFIEVNGQGVGQSYGPAKFVTFPEIISVTPIPPP
jgi:hypothetical protein